MSLKTIAAGALAAAALGVPATAAAQAPAVSVVAKGIDNPRGLAFGPDGTLYVASAGKAGPTCDGKGRNAFCIGFSSAVLALRGGQKSVVAGGLISAGGRDGSFTNGANAVAVGPDGRVVTVTSSGPPEQLGGLPKRVRDAAGTLFRVDGGVQALGAIDEYEWANNVDKVKKDRNSNPYAVLALADRDLVVDAGANAVFQVKDGVVSTFAVLPKAGKGQPVPTSIALGPDGNVYVGELAEAAGPNKARVFRIPAAGGTPEVAHQGFNAISGLAFGPDGSLYVTELTRNFRKMAPGDVVRVAPDGTRTRLGGGGALMFPSGAAIGPDGDLYVSAFSILPAKTPKKGPFKGAGGQVVKVDL